MPVLPGNEESLAPIGKEVEPRSALLASIQQQSPDLPNSTPEKTTLPKPFADLLKENEGLL